MPYRFRFFFTLAACPETAAANIAGKARSYNELPQVMDSESCGHLCPLPGNLPGAVGAGLARDTLRP